MGHFRQSSCRYFLIFAWIGNFIITQTIAEDHNRGLLQEHAQGSTYFFYQRPEFPRDCDEVRQQCSSQNRSGVYFIKPIGFPEPFEVLCANSETTEDGGWMVILRRFDGSVSNKRTWSEYKNGFGFPGSEFWLGNERIAHVTNQKQYELRIDMVGSDGSTFYIIYDKFRLSDERSGYSLSSLGAYSGTAGSFITPCERNMEFGACTCQGTCDQPETRNNCNNNCVNGEGCVCPDGFLFKGRYCVPENECGCFVQGIGVVPNGEIYVSDDCSSRCTCNNDVLTCENYGCSPNANCEERNGVRKCYCEDGYEGDGQICTAIRRSDCLDLYNAGSRNSRVYTIYPSGQWSSTGFQVYCDMTTDGGGWTVFQRRTDGSISFDRDWSNYKRGFGTLTDEHWLGNDKLYAITNQKNYQLRIDLRDSAESSYYALYNLFRVSNEGDNYRLVSLGSFSGKADYDAMGSRRNQSFSTYDNDNEVSTCNCAEKHKGGWWYGYDDGHYCYFYSYCYRWTAWSQNCQCSASNLNGEYGRSDAQSIFWNNPHGNDCNIKFTEMKIRPT